MNKVQEYRYQVRLTEYHANTQENRGDLEVRRWMELLDLRIYVGQVGPKVLVGVLRERGEGTERKRDYVMNCYPTTEEIRIWDD